MKDGAGETPLRVAERRAQCRAQDRPDGLRPSVFGGIASMLGGSGKTAGAAIEWWDLPQELLCAVSQAHYPIALGCLRHWIGQSILAHDRLFAATGAGAADADGAGPAYRECVRRVRQFRRTSDRLGLLAAHEFRTLRGRIRDADVESTGDDEEEGRLHRRLRAWDAVHREVFGGGPC